MNVDMKRDSCHVLPSGWRWVRLGEVSELNPKRPILDREDIASTSFIPMSAIDEQRGIISSPQVRPYVVVKKGYTCLSEGDVLFAKITPCMQNGKHAIAEDLIGGIGFASTEFHVIRPMDCVSAHWIYNYIRQPSILRAAMSSFTGAVGQQRVPVAFLQNLKMPLPAVAEQKRIVGAITEQMASIEKARTAAEAQRGEIEKLNCAYYREVFGEGTPLSVYPGSRQHKPGWGWRLLSDVARLESGHTPSRYHPEWWGGDIPWLALPDIRLLDGRVAHDTQEHTNSAGIENSSARILPKGTVCLSRTASVGYVTILGRPMATSQDFVNWICGPELDPEFLMRLFLYSHDYFVSLASGAIHKTVYMPTVKKLAILMPPLPKQISIAHTLKERAASLEYLKVGFKNQLAEINALPAALLRRAFRGEL